MAGLQSAVCSTVEHGIGTLSTCLILYVKSIRDSNLSQERERQGERERERENEREWEKERWRELEGQGVRG